MVLTQDGCVTINKLFSFSECFLTYRVGNIIVPASQSYKD